MDRALRRISCVPAMSLEMLDVLNSSVRANGLRVSTYNALERSPCTGIFFVPPGGVYVPFKAATICWAAALMALADVTTAPLLSFDGMQYIILLRFNRSLKLMFHNV